MTILSANRYIISTLRSIMRFAMFTVKRGSHEAGGKVLYAKWKADDKFFANLGITCQLLCCNRSAVHNNPNRHTDDTEWSSSSA